MYCLWNEAELSRPPLITINVPNAMFVEKLHQKITKCMKDESNEFAQTAALLSRLIARRKSSFRRMIGFRSLLKLNSAIARLLRLDLKRDLELFNSVLPDMVFGEKSVAALPTRNCLEFVLIRLLSVYHIHLRIHDYSLEAAEYFAELLRANNFLEMSVIVIAALAKIRSLNIELINKYAGLYQSLLKHHEHFPQGNQTKMFDSVEFPLELKKLQITNVTEHETTDVCAEKIKHNVTLKREALKIAKNKIDVGSVVERAERKSKPINEFRVDQLSTVDEVQKFITKENNCRKKSIKSCVTKQIENHLWLGAQKLFERKIQEGNQKKAINVFRKFLSSRM